jgi:hypothetical protein
LVSLAPLITESLVPIEIWIGVVGVLIRSYNAVYDVCEEDDIDDDEEAA